MYHSLRLALTLVGLLLARAGVAADWRELDGEVRAAIHSLYDTVPEARELATHAAGMLVFPRVLEGGLLVGVEYGEGALMVGGQIVDHYSTAAAALGLKLGAQVKTQILLFMSARALRAFKDRNGWEIGVDDEVVLAGQTGPGSLAREAMKEPIVAFIFTRQGLLYNFSLEGSKITRLSK